MGVAAATERSARSDTPASGDAMPSEPSYSTPAADDDADGESLARAHSAAGN